MRNQIFLVLPQQAYLVHCSALAQGAIYLPVCQIEHKVDLIGLSMRSGKRGSTSGAPYDGGSFSPSVGRAAGQVSEDIAHDLSSCTDKTAAALRRTSLVRNGFCPGGPEHWLAHVIWCPAVKVKLAFARNPASKRTTLATAGACSNSNNPEVC